MCSPAVPRTLKRPHEETLDPSQLRPVDLSSLGERKRPKNPTIDYSIGTKLSSSKCLQHHTWIIRWSLRHRAWCSWSQCLVNIRHRHVQSPFHRTHNNNNKFEIRDPSSPSIRFDRTPLRRTQDYEGSRITDTPGCLTRGCLCIFLSGLELRLLRENGALTIL